MVPSLTTPHDPPLYLERQKAVYIGRITNGEERDATFAYYLHSRDALFVGSLSADGFEPLSVLDSDTATMGEAAATFNTLGSLTTDLSIIGEALCRIHSLAETGVLGVQQTYVYVFRDIYGFSQQDTAKLLDIGFSTVSTHLSDARNNVESALAFAEQHSDLAETKHTIEA
jgi:hypothetical protein